MATLTVGTEASSIEPGVRAFMQDINRAYASHPGFAAKPLAERRAIAERIRAPWRAGGPAMRETRDLVTDTDVRLRLHRPDDAQDPAAAMIYVHGGGWTLFSLDTHDRLMREYAARAGIVVIGVDYSLSPEARYPVALNEVADAMRWVRANAAMLGIDAARIALGGDSAGANLSVATSLMLRDKGERQPAALLLNYGAFAAEHMPSYARYDGPEYFLEIAEMDAFWRNYTRTPADLADPLVAPLHAALAGLPPSFLAIAPLDILADCNHALAERLAEAGVPIEARAYAGATHSFLEAMSVSPVANEALNDSAAFLALHLAAR